MRLINTKTLELHEFLDANIPESYAILSHTWAEEEISFQEWRILEANRQPISDNPFLMEFSTRNEAWIQRTERKAGYKKIIDFCHLCRQHEYTWAWVDTCCIDKSSSAELSEAINSMYKWYQNSERCYAYLTDVCDVNHNIKELPVEDGNVLGTLRGFPVDNKPVDFESYARLGFTSSRWFERGWTLQELLAPSQLHFYDRDWKMIGTRYQLALLITNITKIPTKVVSYSSYVDEHPVAERFSWASHRKTSRAEDIAYSMLGLFNIHMPLLYGEGGSNAFRRLQEEIIKKSTDNSIFAWLIQDEADSDHKPNTSFFDFQGQVLARSPKSFKNCGNLTSSRPQSQRKTQDLNGVKKSYTLTNNGLHIELPLFDNPCVKCGKCQIALFNCWTLEKMPQRIGIYLVLSETGQYKRVHCNTLATDITISTFEPAPVIQHIYITTQGCWTTARSHMTNNEFRFLSRLAGD